MRALDKALALVVGAALSLGLTLAPGVASAQSKLDPNLIYNYGEQETPRSAGMGGALRALSSGSSSLYINPAALAETRQYHIEALAQVTPETNRQVYGGSISDSVTGRVAGGLSILGGFMDTATGGLDRSFLDVRLGAAVPLGDRFILGLTGRYLKVSQAGTGTAAIFGSGDKFAGGLVDTSTSPNGRFALFNSVTFDAGLVIKPTDTFYIGISGQNLSYPNNGFLPTMVGGGLGFSTDDFSVEADGLADINSWAKPTARIMAGGEYIIAGHVPIRAGYRFDQGAKLNTVSLGSGFIANEFSIEASVKRSLANPGMTMMVFSVAYFLESAGVTKSPTADVQP